VDNPLVCRIRVVKSVLGRRRGLLAKVGEEGLKSDFSETGQKTVPADLY
jgi:hypothetical protein